MKSPPRRPSRPNVLQRKKFGQSSEKIEREIEQLQLALEHLEIAMAATDTSPESPEAADPAQPKHLAAPSARQAAGRRWHGT